MTLMHSAAAVPPASSSPPKQRQNAINEANGVIPGAEVPLEPVPVRAGGERSDGSDGSSSSGAGASVGPSSTPHTVRSLTSGYQFARVKCRAHEHGAHAAPAHGLQRQQCQQRQASGEEGARFDVAPPLPDGFLQGRDRAHSFGGPARGAAAASMSTLIQQEKTTAAAAAAAASRPPPAHPKPPNIRNENLARFLRTELGAQIFVRHLQAGGYFLKHSSAAAATATATAAAAPMPAPEIPAAAGSAGSAAATASPSSSPHWRHVWVSSDLRTVYWGEMSPARTRRPSGRMPVDQILVIFPGHQTRAFTHKQAAAAATAGGVAAGAAASRLCAPACCFSLVSPARSLDLECVSRSECELWVLAFQFLLDHSRTAGASAVAAVAAGLEDKQAAPAQRLSLVKPLSPAQGLRASPGEGAAAGPPAAANLSLVSALEVLSDLVVHGPTQATYAYFDSAPARPPSPPCALSAQSSAHTSACASPAQGGLRGLAMGPAGRSSSGGSTSSAASSVGSTPAFGSPAFSAAHAVQQHAPGLACSASAQPQPQPYPQPQPAMSTLSLESLAAADAGADTDQDGSSMTSPPQPPQASPPQATSQAQAFPGGVRRKSFVNLESLPEAEEDTAGSTARAPSTAGTGAGAVTGAGTSTGAVEQDCGPLFDLQLVAPTHEPEVATALPSLPLPVPLRTCLDSQQPSAPSLRPQPHPAATSASPLPIGMNASHMRTSLHSLYMSMQAPSVSASAVSAACIGAAAAAVAAASGGPFAPFTPAMSAAAFARMEADVARMERLLGREQHDQAALRVWVAHRFLHLQSHINSLAIERNKLQRRIQAEADDAEAELEREVARVMGATPSQSSRRLAEARCQSSAD